MGWIAPLSLGAGLVPCPSQQSLSQKNGSGGVTGRHMWEALMEEQRLLRGRRWKTERNWYNHVPAGLEAERRQPGRNREPCEWCRCNHDSILVNSWSCKQQGAKDGALPLQITTSLTFLTLDKWDIVLRSQWVCYVEQCADFKLLTMWRSLSYWINRWYLSLSVGRLLVQKVRFVSLRGLKWHHHHWTTA